MSDQLTPELSQLLTDGQNMLSEQRAQRAAEESRKQAERQSAITAEREKFINDVRADIDSVLLPYLVSPIFDGDILPGEDQIVTFAIPGCAPIRQMFRKYRGAHEGSVDWIPNQYRGDPKYRVSIYDLRRFYGDYDDQSEEKVIEVERSGHSYDSHYYGHDHLGIAIALAAEWEATRLVLQAQADAYNLEQSAKRAASEEHRRQQQAATHDAAQHKREALIVKLLNDDVALKLVELFAAIQTEREAWQDTIDDARSNADALAGRYERHLEEKQRMAERDARDAQYEIEAERRKVEDAESELAKIKRQARSA